LANLIDFSIVAHRSMVNVGSILNQGTETSAGLVGCAAASLDFGGMLNAKNEQIMTNASKET